MNQPVIDHYLSEYARLNKVGAAWWLEQQNLAMESIRRIGFPTQKTEEWKYTDLRPILKREFKFSLQKPPPAEMALIDAGTINSLECYKLVFINGYYIPRYSDTVPVRNNTIVKPLLQALAEDDVAIKQHLNCYSDNDKNAFAALNSAFLQSGAAILVPNGISIDKPVHIIYLVDNSAGLLACNPRNLLVLGKNASATVIETYCGVDEVDYFTNTITEISLDNGASLEHYKLQQEGMNSFHIGNIQVQQQKDSRLISHVISLGAKLARNDIDVKLGEHGAEVVLNGLYMADKTQHVDNHTRIDHLCPHTHSTQTYRGVLAGRSRGVFNGKVVVHKNAQKISADQSNANLLLSDDAEIDTKPELEIYADDVKCSHGATIGQLDENMLFYLRTRAIPEDTAKSLLTFAFADEIIRQLGLTPVRQQLEHRIIGQLPDADLIREFVK